MKACAECFAAAICLTDTRMCIKLISTGDCKGYLQIGRPAAVICIAYNYNSYARFVPRGCPRTPSQEEAYREGMCTL
jgi:hypothetical protein